MAEAPAGTTSPTGVPTASTSDATDTVRAVPVGIGWSVRVSSTRAGSIGTKVDPTAAGGGSTGDFSAVSGRTTPKPYSGSHPTAPRSSAVDVSRAASCAGVMAGWRCRSIATAAATCGVAMEVPDIRP